jgi:hypothetical protein
VPPAVGDEEAPLVTSQARRPTCMTDTVCVASSVVHDAILSSAQTQHPGRPEGKGAVGSEILGEGVHGRQHHVESLRVVHEVPRGQVNR